MRFLLPGAALLLLGAYALGDTIVLKNGRRIAALSAVEEGDKVKYMTSAGELSLPKSIVDHIEKGGFSGASGPPGDAAANLTIAPIEIRPAGGDRIEEIERAAVHDGSVDHQYIAKLETEARSGNSRATYNAALGNHEAAHFASTLRYLQHAISEDSTAGRAATAIARLSLTMETHY